MFEPHQVVHRNQILATGISSLELSDLVRTGVVTRLWRGIYTTGAALDLPDPRGVTRSMRVVLSHVSAAAWWGVDLPTPVDRLHVTAPRNRGRRAACAPRVRLHRYDLKSSDVATLRGVRVTTPTRTVIDLARSMPLAQAVAVADGFIRQRLVTAAALAVAANMLPAAPGRRGARAVAQLVDPRAESVFESITRVQLVLAGLPAPVTQLNIRRTDGRWIARVDFAWPDLRVVLECDGFEFHGSREAFERDRRRWSALTQQGWRVLVVTWRDVTRDPAYVAELVRTVLADPTGVAHNVAAASAV